MDDNVNEQYRSWQQVSAGAADSHAADWRRRTLEQAAIELEKAGASGLAGEVAFLAGEATCWPIAKLTVKGEVVTASLYAPGLPDGEFDVWLESNPDEALCLECQGGQCTAAGKCEAMTHPPAGKSFDKLLDAVTQELIEAPDEQFASGAQAVQAAEAELQEMREHGNADDATEAAAHVESVKHAGR